MSMSRSIERSIIKYQCRVRDGNTNNFKDEWKKYHDNKVEQAKKNNKVNTIRKTKIKKKQNHFDNGKLAIRQWKRMKEMLANMKKKKLEESEQSESNN